MAILTNCGVPFFLDILNTNDEDTLNASSYVIQLILDSLSDAHVINKVKEMRKNPRMMTSEERKWCNQVENERNDLIRSEYRERNVRNLMKNFLPPAIALRFMATTRNIACYDTSPYVNVSLVNRKTDHGHFRTKEHLRTGFFYPLRDPELPYLLFEPNPMS